MAEKLSETLEGLKLPYQADRAAALEAALAAARILCPDCNALRRERDEARKALRIAFDVGWLGGDLKDKSLKGFVKAEYNKTLARQPDATAQEGGP